MAKKRGTEIYKDEWIKLYNDGMSYKQIANVYGFASSSVRARISDFVNKRDKYENDKYAKVWGELYEQGYNTAQIAEVYGGSKHVVYRVLKKYQYIKRNEDKGKCAHLKDDIIRLYEDGKSLREIGELLDISSQTALDYVRRVKPEIIRESAVAARRYSINEECFDDLNKRTSFIVGLMIKTTFVYEKCNVYKIRIGFPGRKKYILDYIFRGLGFEVKNYVYNKKEDFFRPEIGRDKLSRRMKELGFREIKKPYNRVDIPMEFKIDYINGYIYSSFLDYKNVIKIECIDSCTKEEIEEWLVERGIINDEINYIYNEKFIVLDKLKCNKAFYEVIYGIEKEYGLKDGYLNVE